MVLTLFLTRIILINRTLSLTEFLLEFRSRVSLDQALEILGEIRFVLEIDYVLLQIKVKLLKFMVWVLLFEDLLNILLLFGQVLVLVL
jgi:hypothetical protein